MSQSELNRVPNVVSQNLSRQKKYVNLEQPMRIEMCDQVPFYGFKLSISEIRNTSNASKMK